MQKDKEYSRDKRSPKPLSESVSRVMSANKAKDTGPELLVRKWLFYNGYRGYRLHYKKVPGRPDICFVRQKCAIFVHGCFWHHCPNCSTRLPKHNTSFWQEKFAKNTARDAKKIEALEALGWRCLVIWECQSTPQLSTEVIHAIGNLLEKNE